jgi:hypothetical protein
MKLKLSIMALVLLLISGCDSSSATGEGSMESEPSAKAEAGWYMRTVAKATASDNSKRARMVKINMISRPLVHLP